MGFRKSPALAAGRARSGESLRLGQQETEAWVDKGHVLSLRAAAAAYRFLDKFLTGIRLAGL